MAEAESSTDQRMCVGNEGVVFEDTAPQHVRTRPASILYGSLLARKLKIIIMGLELGPEC